MRAFVIVASVLLLAGGLAACQSEQQIEYNRYYSAGAAVYKTHCQNCHGDNGQGLAALIPPLTDTAYLKSNKALLACVLHVGIKSKIMVNGKAFESEMPPTDLTPIEIAQVLTYVTNSFGNQQGLINTDVVERDLKECK